VAGGVKRPNRAPEEFLDAGPLFAPRLPPHNQRATSLAAAQSKQTVAATERERVYEAIRRMGTYGATREELQSKLSMAGDTVRPRCWELLGNSGHTARIRVSDAVRSTKSGRAAEVLVAL
jgi:hypothetical protein